MQADEGDDLAAVFPVHHPGPHDGCDETDLLVERNQLIEALDGDPVRRTT